MVVGTRLTVAMKMLVLMFLCCITLAHSEESLTEEDILQLHNYDLTEYNSLNTEESYKWKEHIAFYLWNSKFANHSIPLNTKYDFSVFDKKKPLKFVIHGWKSSSTADWVVEMRDIFHQLNKFNLIVIDWSYLASTSYPAAVIYTAGVSISLSNFIIAWECACRNTIHHVHIVGHSLGAQAAGLTGDLINKHFNFSHKIGRITGLDPAGPGFDLFPANQSLDSTDASFVDVIHTSTGLTGMDKIIGVIDFYPNGGMAPQPGCDGLIEGIGCSHTRAILLFIESINSRAFLGKECRNYWWYKHGLCDYETDAVMGYPVNLGSKGVFYLNTNAAKPFGRFGKI